MGGIIKASCRCGYRREMFLGGGMQNFTTYCNFPIFCRSCKLLLEVNLLKVDITCPHCKGTDFIPYDDPSLCARKGIDVFTWNYEKIGRELVLTDGHYFCPSCGEKLLTFSNIGDWD